jgi:hypothetical protein
MTTSTWRTARRRVLTTTIAGLAIAAATAGPTGVAAHAEVVHDMTITASGSGVVHDMSAPTVVHDM